ncbi:MAG: hypothetical protein JWQ19_2089 [Subtercola sp.]|nr:hypothetical protein [Subtercola sp.]
MAAGPWMADRDGVVHPGTLGLLLDIGLSMPVLYSRPSLDRAPVTVCLSLSFVPNADLLDGPLVVSSELMHSDDDGGQGRGEARNNSGAIVAFGSVECQQFPLPDGWNVIREEAGTIPEPGFSLDEMFGLPSTRPGSAELVVPSAQWFSNPRATFHGGVLVALLEYVAASALPGGARDWCVATLRVDFVRPVLTGSILRVEAKLLQEGRRLGIVSARAVGAQGKPMCFAQASYIRRQSGSRRTSGSSQAAASPKPGVA